MNEFEARDVLREKRQGIKDLDELMAYIKDVEENYNYDYGVAPRAMAQASLAVAYYLCDKFGITGFQAGFVMWDFIQDWMYKNNKCGLKLVDYDNMLFPQYAYRYEKTISSDTWDSLQKQAAELLSETEYAHPDVVAHWQSIVDGVVPFGYKVKD